MPSSGRRPQSFFQLIRRRIWLIVLATIALVLIAAVVPGVAMLAVRWYLVGVAVLATVGTIQAIAARFPAYDRSRENPFARRSRDSDELPQRLREIDRLVAYSRWSAVDYDERLRPILYAIARQRLAAYRSIASETDPAAARALLGERVWALIAPRRTGRDARVLSVAELGTIVTALEGIDAAPRC